MTSSTHTRYLREACALAVLLEETARAHHLAATLGKAKTIDTRGREHACRAAANHENVNLSHSSDDDPPWLRDFGSAQASRAALRLQ